MNKQDVKELHFITYIDNVPSIMSQGILSHNKSKDLNYCDISEEGVQNRRSVKKILGTKRKLHDYANLYFDAHNPMLSRIRGENGNICVLRVENEILNTDGVIITDKNAARDCWFKTVEDGLPLLSRDEIYAEFWIDFSNRNLIEEYRHAGIKCAEVLVPNYVHPDHIFGAYTVNTKALNKLCNISTISGIIKSSLFF